MVWGTLSSTARAGSAQTDASPATRVIVTSMLGIYALVNVLAWRGSEVITTWDSPRYTGGDFFFFLNPGIPPTILFSSFADLRWATLTQTIIYVLVWSSLATAVLASLRSTWIKWPLAGGALLLSLSAPLWSWNLVVGSEGLTVSAVVLWMSTFVWMATRSSTSALVASYLAASVLLITRPQTLIFVVPIQIVATVWWMRRSSHSFGAVKRTIALVAVLLIAATGWATYRAALLANDDVYAHRYALHNLVEKTPSFRQYVLNEAPPCEAIPAALNGPQPWIDVIAFDETLINQCPETFIWFKSDAVSAQQWIAYDPVAAILNFRDIMWIIALPVGTEYSPLPDSIGKVLLPVHHLWLALGVALTAGILLGVVGRVRFRGSALGVVGVGVSVAALTVYLFAVWAADGYDVIRHMVPITPLVPVAAFILPTGLTGKR